MRAVGEETMASGLRFSAAALGAALAAAAPAAVADPPKQGGPPTGVLSPRSSNFEMVDKIEASDPATVMIRLKFPTSAFLPALADPFAFIYSKAQLDKDPHWFEKNIMGSGPFKMASYETGQSI